MKYRINRIALLTQMNEYGQNMQQRLKYLKHYLSCVMSYRDLVLFNNTAMDYNIYYMMLNDACIEMQIKYNGYYVFVQKKLNEYVIEIMRV